MSKKFETVKNYYEKGFWGIERVRNAVLKGWVTEDEFKEITGVEY